MNNFKGGKRVLIGDAELDSIFEGIKRVFLVCDPFLAESGKYVYISHRLENIGIDYQVYSDVTPDPSIDVVSKAITAMAEYKPDMVIGLGGGSAIDTCKAMIYFGKANGLIDNVIFTAVPTTSGTGSEVTDFAVISDTDKGVKYPIVDDSLLPDIAVIDAHLTLTVPPQVTAATGMDVLTHAIEALVSKNATDFSDSAAEKAIKLVRSNILTVYREPDNLKARQEMHNASCLAGIAFNNAGLGLNHGMAHALGAKFHIPHGKANAILLPYVMGFNAGCFDSLNENAIRYARIARLIRVDSESVRTSALNLIRTIKKTNEQLGIPKTISEMGISIEEFKEALDVMAADALKDRCTATNPRECTVEDIKKIYTHCYFGRLGKEL